ncbi:MAG: prepilin peptidase [Alphaproteobacteria bacterium]|nr:prepilin peptidase [Alphaproteobacteria bacterium]
MFASILACFLLCAALALLYNLARIDLKTRLLPNKLVFPFALLGVLFHAVLSFGLLPLSAMMIGAALGGGILLGIRTLANAFYKQDTLGLGDVKLMAAAGLWLGPDVLLALTLGAVAGLLHGLGVALWTHHKNKQPVNLARLEIPAGPGFIVGILIGAAVKFQSLPTLLF